MADKELPLEQRMNEQNKDITGDKTNKRHPAIEKMSDIEKAFFMGEITYDEYLKKGEEDFAE